MGLGVAAGKGAQCEDAVLEADVGEYGFLADEFEDAVAHPVPLAANRDGGGHPVDDLVGEQRIQVVRAEARVVDHTCELDEDHHGVVDGRRLGCDELGAVLRRLDGCGLLDCRRWHRWAGFRRGSGDVAELAVGGGVVVVGNVDGGGGARTSGLGSTAVISTSELSELLELLLRVLMGPRTWLPKTGAAGVCSCSCLTSGCDGAVAGAGSGVVSDGRIQLASGRMVAGGA